MEVEVTATRSRFCFDVLHRLQRAFVCVAILGFGVGLPASAQLGLGGLPFMNTGPDSAFAQVDFAQIYMDTANKEQQKNAEQKAQRQHLVDIGAVSALDLDAPGKALDEYNRAATLMKEQNTKQAIVHLQKAIAAYPKFVLAHNTLGLAYLDQQDDRAKSEFEAAAGLDQKFPGTFLNLGMLELAANDLVSANSHLQQAATLSPNDVKILAALAFAQSGSHQLQQTLDTVQRVHALDHRGLAKVHYIAASAALGLQNFDAVQRELTIFLAEDPTNPLAPIARKNLDALTRRQGPAVQTSGSATTQSPTSGRSQPAQTFPNSEHLQAELKAVGNEPAGAAEPDTAEKNTTLASASPGLSTPSPVTPTIVSGLFTIRRAVDETALFFAVSSHGHLVSDLELSNIHILDNTKPPERITQFIPQSKLPLRLALLIDTSGSVQDRFSFEKRAAAKFVEKVLNPDLDLGFVAGFSSEIGVTQDFTAKPEELAQGITKLTNGGGTSLFDAVSFACWKLAAYPESERVARVLVLLTDGEDNSSHRSLKQSIAEAEKAGVTIFTVSTADHLRAETDADQILQVLAERSGGESMFPGDMQTLESSLNRLRDLIRSRYLVVYKPAGLEANGKFRPVRVTAERKGERLQVHVRKGYNARLE